jgi:hypothetical protein
MRAAGWCTLDAANAGVCIFLQAAWDRRMAEMEQKLDALRQAEQQARQLKLQVAQGEEEAQTAPVDVESRRNCLRPQLPSPHQAPRILLP